MARSYTVVFSSLADGWTASIPGKPGGATCIARGKRLHTVRNRLRKVLGQCLGDPAAGASATFLETFRGVQRNRQLGSIRARRAELEANTAELAEASRLEAQLLIDRGYSLRDVAELVGLSYQRVGQLTRQAVDR